MTESPSYIDYEAFLDPSFSATSFANGLILSTNNPSDTPLDLSTPLSRVLFDVQEIDTHIHTLTTKSAVPLLTHTKQSTEASERILHEVETQVKSLTDGYQRLEKEVTQRHAAAEEVRLVTSRLWETVKIGRSVSRCLTLGRQLEAQMTEVSTSASASKRDDHRAMIRASNTVLSLRQLFAASGPGEEGEGLARVNVVQTLKSDLFTPSEATIRSRAQQIIREFSMSSLASTSSSTTTSSSAASATTYAQAEATKSRTTSACTTLYLLSDASSPNLLVAALTSYLQTTLLSSSTSLSRALTSLPTLDRTLLEVSARCQNIVALEALLESIRPPAHPLSLETAPPQNLLVPLLQTLDTPSLPSHFWRSLASSLAPRVQEIVSRGGVHTRALRGAKDRIKEGIRECVARGSRGVEGTGSKRHGANANWEREVAVMVGAVVGGLGR